MSDIRIDYINFEEIEKWPRNPKDHDLQELKKSFDRFGFITPVLFDENTKKLVAGHGRLDALSSIKANGNSPPKGVKIDGDNWLVPVILGVHFRDPAEAESYLLADNRLSEAGGWKKELLTEIIREMGSAKDINLLEGTGFNIEDFLPPEEKYDFMSDEDMEEVKSELRNGVFISVGFCDIIVMPSDEYFDLLFNFSGKHREFTDEERRVIIKHIAEGIHELRTREENTNSGEQHN